MKKFSFVAMVACYCICVVGGFGAWAAMVLPGDNLMLLYCVTGVVVLSFVGWYLFRKIYNEN